MREKERERGGGNGSKCKYLYVQNLFSGSPPPLYLLPPLPHYSSSSFCDFNYCTILRWTRGYEFWKMGAKRYNFRQGFACYRKMFFILVYITDRDKKKGGGGEENVFFCLYGLRIPLFNLRELPLCKLISTEKLT